MSIQSTQLGLTLLRRSTTHHQSYWNQKIEQLDLTTDTDHSLRKMRWLFSTPITASESGGPGPYADKFDTVFGQYKANTATSEAASQMLQASHSDQAMKEDISLFCVASMTEFVFAVTVSY